MACIEMFGFITYKKPIYMFKKYKNEIENKIIIIDH